MNKNLGIFFPFTSGNAEGLVKCYDMSDKLLKFFMYIAQRCDDNKFIAGLRQEKALHHFEISKATYYNRVNKLVESKLLIKESRGIYRVNLRYAKVISDKDKDLKMAIKNFVV